MLRKGEESRGRESRSRDSGMSTKEELSGRANGQIAEGLGVGGRKSGMTVGASEGSRK